VPGNADYDTARQVFYGGVDKKPAVIVEVAGTEDIKRAIALAQEHSLELAVRSGGHSVAGYCSTDGGIVIDLRQMRGIKIDTATKTVWRLRARRNCRKPQKNSGGRVTPVWKPIG